MEVLSELLFKYYHFVIQIQLFTRLGFVYDLLLLLSIGQIDLDRFKAYVT